MTHLEITFTNNNVLSIDYEGEMDLHKLGTDYLSFNDIWVNLANVLFIRKKNVLFIRKKEE